MDTSCDCGAVSRAIFLKQAVGEIIGTFLMCFFGIGAVATATLYGAHTGPFQVGMIWGLAIAIAIYATRNLSAAHFNPAVTFAMCASGRCSWINFPLYVVAQFVGAILAGFVLWIFFADSVQAALSAASATMEAKSAAYSIWCEVYPNTAKGVISTNVAAFAEGLGVFVLVMVIFCMTESCNLGRPSNDLFPLFIGLTVTCIIAVVGPMTDAGLNPARDMGPRVVAFLVGFKEAFSWDVLYVYALAPMIGGLLASLFFTKVIEPLHVTDKKNNSCNI
ncbi:MIP/aquaporin family protein [Campylobacter curvus]|uniref:MIP/aquaporin family protein n=1 Tax=Campylobacter curvus TaxID=200 RepID=UPI000372D4D3|nr:MIP/aquaporin family protein [Campylobacter curvus]QKF62127.1 aquaporin family protein [Campylobacter curvus]UEB50414.1 aquaporin family protein [Campylobacter curvus]